MAPDRIGHGTHTIHDRAAVELVRERGVTLEMCPWSNYLTNSVRRVEDHPLKQLFDRGVKVTINSDDPEVLDTNLNNEYRIAHEILGMSLEEIAACNRCAAEASFIPDRTSRQSSRSTSRDREPRVGCGVRPRRLGSQARDWPTTA